MGRTLVAASLLIALLSNPAAGLIAPSRPPRQRAPTASAATAASTPTATPRATTTRAAAPADDDKPAAATLKEALLDALLAWFRDSELVAAAHAKHVASDTVSHLFKGTPMAAAPDALKLRFVGDGAGRFVSDFMRREQQTLGEWKQRKVVEAAGPAFDERGALAELSDLSSTAPVVVLSFVDCPWCLAAKELLATQSSISPEAVRVVELEELGRQGKALRAAAALATGRTSMPNVWIGGRSVGGYTDGYDGAFDLRLVRRPELCVRSSPGLLALRDSGELDAMLRDAERNQRTLETFMFDD